MKDPNKPKKIILSIKNQKEIISKVKKLVIPFSKEKNVQKIVICGSLANMKLGKYVREYHGMNYSDIDILLITDGNVKIPSSFKVGPKLPENIMKNIRKMFYRYSSMKKIDNKFEIHLHVFNKKVHDKKLASKFGWSITRAKGLLIYNKL